MTEEGNKQPVVLSRDDLYQKVWTTPMNRLAAQYGITGNGLAKICLRLNIPCPARGYWAKKAAGKRVVQYRLPEPDAETLLQVTITPTPPPPKTTEVQSEIQKQLETARADNSELVVPARLVRPHPIIAEWLAEHERKKQEAKRQSDPWRRESYRPAEFTEVDRRKHRFLDTLFKNLERLGFIIKTEQYRGVYCEVQNERVDYQLREKQKQVRRPLTDDEKRWYPKGTPWKQELQPSGILIFTIKTWLADGMRREWKDEPDKPLEDNLPEIVATLSLAGPFLVKKREERAEAEKRRWEEEHRRYLEKQRNDQDLKRRQKFLEFARHRDEAASVRRLLAELEAKPQPDDFIFDGLSPTEWLAWARDWLARFDPLLREPYDLYEELANIRP